MKERKKLLVLMQDPGKGLNMQDARTRSALRRFEQLKEFLIFERTSNDWQEKNLFLNETVLREFKKRFVTVLALLTSFSAASDQE